MGEELASLVGGEERTAWPVKLDLSKNSKGYTWKIQVSALTADEALTDLRRVDAILLREYGE